MLCGCDCKVWPFLRRRLGLTLEVAAGLAIVGEQYLRKGLDEQAEQSLRRALAIRESSLPASDPDRIASLRQLGDLLAFQGRYKEASEFHRRMPLPPAPALGAYRPAGGLAFPERQMLVFFGTNRRHDPNSPDSFSSDAATERSVGYAAVDISGPALGAKRNEENDGLLKYADPLQLSVQAVRILNEETLLGEVRPRIAKASKSAGQAFVFVHGFSVSFDNALRRTAQLEHDLGFDGAAFVYSWPSHGQFGASDYFADQRNSLAAADDLHAFLEFVVAKSGAKIVHLIAHSMGNPLLMEALKGLQSKPAWADLHIGQVILAASDMDAGEFMAAVPLLRSVATGITLYASASDQALRVSSVVNGFRGPRAGSVMAQGPVVIDGV
jgi:esterase/lipase superfamily enzyme